MARLNRPVVVLCALAILAAGVGLPAIVRLFGRESRPAAVIVNGEVITRDEVYQAMFRQLGRATVDRLVTRALIRQTADEQDVTVDASEVEGELAEIREQFESEEHFQQTLAVHGLDEAALRQEVELDLLARMLVEREVTITEEQARARHAEQPGAYAGEFEQVREEIMTNLLREAVNERMPAWLKGLRETASIVDYSERP